MKNDNVKLIAVGAVSYIVNNVRGLANPGDIFEYPSDRAESLVSAGHARLADNKPSSVNKSQNEDDGDEDDAEVIEEPKIKRGRPSKK